MRAALLKSAATSGASASSIAPADTRATSGPKVKDAVWDAEPEPEPSGALVDKTRVLSRTRLDNGEQEASQRPDGASMGTASLGLAQPVHPREQQREQAGSKQRLKGRATKR